MCSSAWFKFGHVRFVFFYARLEFGHVRNCPVMYVPICGHKRVPFMHNSVPSTGHAKSSYRLSVLREFPGKNVLFRDNYVPLHRHFFPVRYSYVTRAAYRSSESIQYIDRLAMQAKRTGRAKRQVNGLPGAPTTPPWLMRGLAGGPAEGRKITRYGFISLQNR